MPDFEVNKRFKTLIEAMRMSPGEFSKAYNDPKAVKTYQVISQRNGLSNKFLEEILKAYPRISRTWLLTGEGEMFLPDHNIVSENKLIYTRSIAEKSSKSHDVGEENIAGNNILRNFKIPFYDIEISAGTVKFYEDYPELPHSQIEVPFINDCDLAMPVYGDSMYPKIKNGDIVMLKKMHDTTLILYGEIYLIITDDYRTLKYIRKNKDDDSKVILVSENENFDPVVVSKSSILHLFLYKGKFEKSQI